MAENKTEQLKAILDRLNAGEEIETVQKDFIREFEDVPINDIFQAEKELIQAGVPAQELKKLCSFHEVLFHGRSEAEVYLEENRPMKVDRKALPEGHPVLYFIRENTSLMILMQQTMYAVKADKTDYLKTCLKQLKKIRVLYGKKEELIMPLLAKYGIDQPEKEMWPVDDAIKIEVSHLGWQLEQEDNFPEICRQLLKRMNDMIRQEENDLLPMALEHFTQEDWYGVYRDLHEMGPVFLKEIPVWEEAEDVLSSQKKSEPCKQTITFQGKVNGSMTVAQLQAVLGTLPLDMTFIDAQEINRCYKNTDAVFARPLSSLDRSTYDCHPERVKPMIEKMIADFKAGKKDYFERYIPDRKSVV